MIVSLRWAGALLASVGTVSGCVVTGEVGYTCDPSIYEEGHLGPDGKADFCHRRDPPPDAGSGCGVGVCTKVPLYWDGPTLLWAGPAGQAPECPTGPTGIAWEGHDDLMAPNDCEACTCGVPTGTCALPSAFTASTKACNIQGGGSASFDAPVPWDGQCDTVIQVPASVATSLTIAPLTVMENGCMPSPPVAAKMVSAYWATDARACHGPGFLPCLDNKSACTPNEDPLDFRVCITHEGKHDCPMGPGDIFTEQHIFYDGIKDDRQCSACTCGPPTGSLCTAMVSVYQGAGGMCGGSIVEQLPISSVSSKCVDIQPPGQALGGKSAGPTTYAPGACQPMGGEPSGIATESTSFTFCCRPINFSQPAP